MAFFPLLAALDWDSVLYFLIPLVWVALQFLGGKKSGADGAETPKGETTPTEQAERMRRVQEEIRRRIAERQEEMRRALEGGQPQPVPDPVAPSAAPPPVPMRRVEPMAPPPVPAAAEARGGHLDLEQRLAEQRRRLADSRQAHAVALERAKEMDNTTNWGRDLPAPSGGIRGGSIRDQVAFALESPQAARSAIVLGEVLGPPRALRPFE